MYKKWSQCGSVLHLYFFLVTIRWRLLWLRFIMINDSAAQLIYDLNKHFPDEFMASIFSSHFEYMFILSILYTFVTSLPHWARSVPQFLKHMSRVSKLTLRFHKQDFSFSLCSINIVLKYEHDFNSSSNTACNPYSLQPLNIMIWMKGPKVQVLLF